MVLINIQNNQGEFLFRVAGILRIGDKILFQKKEMDGFYPEEERRSMSQLKKSGHS
jgi:hypothetical protein